MRKATASTERFITLLHFDRNANSTATLLVRQPQHNREIGLYLLTSVVVGLRSVYTRILCNCMYICISFQELVMWCKYVESCLQHTELHFIIGCFYEANRPFYEVVKRFFLCNPAQHVHFTKSVHSGPFYLWTESFMQSLACRHDHLDDLSMLTYIDEAWKLRATYRPMIQANSFSTIVLSIPPSSPHEAFCLTY